MMRRHGGRHAVAEHAPGGAAAAECGRASRAGLVGITVSARCRRSWDRGSRPGAHAASPHVTRALEQREGARAARRSRNSSSITAMGKISEADFAEHRGPPARREPWRSMEQLEAACRPQRHRSSTRRGRRRGDTAHCPACGTRNDPDAQVLQELRRDADVPRAVRNADRAATHRRLVRARSLLSSCARVAAAIRLGAQVAMPDPRPCPVPAAGCRTCRWAPSASASSAGASTTTSSGRPSSFVDRRAKPRPAVTDAEGPAQVTGLARGTRVRANAVVDGERLESQEGVVQASGLRIILVATDPEAAARGGRQDAGRGAGREGHRGARTRVAHRRSDVRRPAARLLHPADRQFGARRPVDIGGPLLFDLPREARGHDGPGGVVAAGDGQRARG